MDRGIQELDSVWRAIKPWGKFQLFQIFLVLLDFSPACFAILSAVFTGYIPEYTCDVPETGDNETDLHDNFTYKASQCEYDVYKHIGNTSAFVETRKCDKFTFSNTLSYAYEWNLVCSRSNLAALAQSLALAGQGLGAFVTSHVADRFGRKRVYVISHIGVMTTMAVMAFSTNIYMLLSLRLVTGTFQQGVVCTGKILALEMFPREVRSHTEVATFLSWSVGIMVLSVFGYAFRGLDWRYLQIGLAAFSFYALFEWWMLEESIRWLLCNGKVEEAKRILKKATKWNGVGYKEAEELLNQCVHIPATEAERPELNGTEMDLFGKKKYTFLDGEKPQDDSATHNPTVEKYNVIDILKNPALRANTLILWYSWIVAAGTYYGLTLVSSHLAGDRFVNFFLSGLIEVPPLLLELYLFNKIGRKRTMILWFSTAGMSLIISTALLTVFKDNAGETVATVFSLIGKAASTGCFSTVFLYTPEIYPTNYRNSGLGIASSISRIGGILAPFASNLALIALWIPGAIFGGMCLLVVLLAIRLPESAVHELPTTIAECNKWERDTLSSSDVTPDSSSEDVEKFD
ncbi:organic cation transporter protein-like [Mercenaria mercenaria]|uniref:organic cation transporter protein-like n=1 Tax=Mercenaria mercenaria TaxID=6596 RepID=UPI00234F9245|nr:organic cation transporter protein-like [Mercenaria mercenaria]